MAIAHFQGLAGRGRLWQLGCCDVGNGAGGEHAGRRALGLAASAQHAARRPSRSIAATASRNGFPVAWRSTRTSAKARSARRWSTMPSGGSAQLDMAEHFGFGLDRRALLPLAPAAVALALAVLVTDRSSDAAIDSAAADRCANARPGAGAEACRAAERGRREGPQGSRPGVDPPGSRHPGAGRQERRRPQTNAVGLERSGQNGRTAASAVGQPRGAQAAVRPAEEFRAGPWRQAWPARSRAATCKRRFRNSTPSSGN